MCSHLLRSGPDMHPGAGRSPRGTSAAPRTPSLAPNLPATWQRPSSVSSRYASRRSHTADTHSTVIYCRRWKTRPRRMCPRPSGASGPAASNSMTWSSSGSSTCRWGRGKRTSACFLGGADVLQKSSSVPWTALDSRHPRPLWHCGLALSLPFLVCFDLPSPCIRPAAPLSLPSPSPSWASCG